MAFWTVARYSILLNAKATLRAQITLVDATGTNKAELYFQQADTLPNNSVVGSTVYLYYPHDMLGPMMEMLREEGPIQVTHTTGWFVICGSEIPGEDEGP